MIRTLIADDHQIVAEGLMGVLEGHDEVKVLGHVENGQEVLDFLMHHRVDVIVMDINMPVMDGITCSKKVKAAYPNTRIVILTMYAQKSFIEEIVKIGIDGCLLKSNSSDELIESIRRVHTGKSYYDLINEFSSNEEEVKKFKLSEREIEIIQLLSDGLTSSDIGEKLFISEYTVKTHRKNILRKLGLHSTSQLIQFSVNNQII